MTIEWQIPVRDNPLKNEGYKINERAKIHCFVDTHSLCGKYYMVPGVFETLEGGQEGIKEYMQKHPEAFCKSCVKKFESKIFQSKLAWIEIPTTGAEVMEEESPLA